MQPKAETKSSSVNKNYMSQKNNLSNNLIGPAPTLLNSKGQHLAGNTNKRGIGQ
ncbi:MAG: hypothetical protein KDD45_14730 [Bdellovibrionales bacterium]|nr:hypothetical protein [Bdellovibrionales bacterium]